MIIDASRGEIQLDDLFNAIEQDKDQVTQALDLYGDYLKIKNDNTKTGEEKIQLLEQILKLECIEKTIVNHNHENERSRINLKWNVLSECGIWHRKLNLYQKAIGYFEKANTINNRVSTIYYEMGMCYLELGNVYQVKTCFEKTIEISHEHVHWKCLEQIIYLYFILGNFSKCLEYIRIGYDRVAAYQSIYDFGCLFLNLLEKKQPSMKLLIEKMFKNELEYRIEDANLEELERNIREFKEKLFKKKKPSEEKRSVDEDVTIENFQDFGQYLVKKLRESNGDNSKLCKLIDIKKYLPKNEIIVEQPEQMPMETESKAPEEEQPQPKNNRKKRSCLPLNIDDYEKRRSARSITRMTSDDTNVSITDKLQRILSNDDSSSDEEGDETEPSPENNNNNDTAPKIVSEIPKENFPSLHIDYKPFIQSIEQIITNGHQYHYIDLICDYINELTKHSTTLWSNEMRMIFIKLFDCLIDHVQYSTTEIESNHLRACLCYVENALGSAKSDLSEDSIERFSCFARLKVKYKSLGYCFARLQFFLYAFKNSSIQQKQFDIDETLYRILWISSLYYFLSDVQDDALACIYQLQHLLPDTVTIILPNLFNHTTISRSTIESLYLRLKNNNEKSSNSSSSQELTYILSRIAVAEENDELASLIKKLEKKIKLFYANLSTQGHLQKKSIIKCYETLVNVLDENQHLNEKENLNVRKIFDQIFIQIIDMIIKILNEDSQWRDTSLKTIEKLTLTLIDSIMKRSLTGNKWSFKSINPWILLYRVAIKRDSKKNEQFIVSYVRTVHELFGKSENCLIENGALLEYFLLELIQIEHPDIRKRLFSKTIIDNKSSQTSDESNEQKSKLSKVIDEIEQCIYCLYGLVLRKSKMKYLNDHDCPPLELTLEKASIVFYALRPKQLPGYEGRVCTITNETESLFQRFESMIEWDDEREQRRKLLLTYISDATSINSQGKQSEELIHLSDKPFKSNNALFEKDLYYLFADYYLKMGSKDAAANESSKKKAQEYYIKDLCLNTKRFDSWAGLTVIEFYKIEEFITADDFDPRIFNVHMSASCFFRQAVSVDTNNLTLWMEYAEITYILQSYCSKYKDKAVDYVPDRAFLLNICKEAYEKANLCTDNDENKEDWTYLYMMAKIEEKLHPQKLFDALKKYVAALDLLHENKAVYPRKIGHHTSTSNSKGTLLGCHAVEMFYRVHASTLKYLNRHNKESVDFTIDKLTELHEFLSEMQTKPFATSYYEKTTIPNDGHSAQLISEQYFPHKSDLLTDPWLIMYNKCIWLCVEGLYICIARYNRHYRGLYRLAHFFHTSEHYRNDRLSLEFFLGGGVLELKNYPKIIGLYQERSKHNLFNGIWRIQPLDADRTGSFNASMYKSTRLFIDLLLQFDEQLFVLCEVLRQLLEKPDLEKKYLREVERKLLCQHAIKTLFRTIKKRVLLKTREDIEREGMKIISSIMDDNDPNNIPVPILFEVSINLYNLIKNYPDFYQNSRMDELVELTFQRYRPILKFSNHLPEKPKAENLTLIYTPKKQKQKRRPPPPTTTTEQPTVNRRSCVEAPLPPATTTVQSTATKRSYVEAPPQPTTTNEQPAENKRLCVEASSRSTTTITTEESTVSKHSYVEMPPPTIIVEQSTINKRTHAELSPPSATTTEQPTVNKRSCIEPPLLQTTTTTEQLTANELPYAELSSPPPPPTLTEQPVNEPSRVEAPPPLTTTEQPTANVPPCIELSPSPPITTEQSTVNEPSCVEEPPPLTTVEQPPVNEQPYVEPSTSPITAEQPSVNEYPSAGLSPKTTTTTTTTEESTTYNRSSYELPSPPSFTTIEQSATHERSYFKLPPPPPFITTEQPTANVPSRIELSPPTAEQSTVNEPPYIELSPSPPSTTISEQPTVNEYLRIELSSPSPPTSTEQPIVHERLDVEPSTLPTTTTEQPTEDEVLFAELSSSSPPTVHGCLDVEPSTSTVTTTEQPAVDEYQGVESSPSPEDFLGLASFLS